MIARIIFAFGVIIIVTAGGMIALQTLELKEAGVVVAEIEETKIEPAADTPPPPTTMNTATDETVQTLADSLETLKDAVENGEILELQPDVSEEVATQSANFADAMRARLGGVPDLAGGRPDPLIVKSNERYRDVTDLYYSTWDNLIRRCWASVKLNEIFDDAGLNQHGEIETDDNTPWTKQTWFSADKAFKVTYTLDPDSDTSSGFLRRCFIETNRFALAKQDAVALLKDRYDVWWEEEQLENISTFVEYPYTVRENDGYHAAITEIGSAQGCRINIYYHDMGIASERDATFNVYESNKYECDTPAGQSRGGVTTGRLPQVGN